MGGGTCEGTSTQTSVNEKGQEVTIFKSANPFVNVTYATVTAAATLPGFTTIAGSTAATASNSTSVGGNNVKITSRSKMMVARARDVPVLNNMGNVTASVSLGSLPPPILAPTTDVLDIAVKRGIKIISCRRMLDFLNQNVNMPGVQDSCLLTIAGSISGGDSKGESKMKSIKAVPITGSFIKMETVEQKYRPSFKVFQCWPDLNVDAGGTGCPFRLTNIPLHVQEKMKEHQNKIREMSQIKTKESTQQKNTTPIITTTQTSIKKVANKKKNPSFCEVCAVEFENMHEHLKTYKHEQYTQDQENYRELTSVIRSLSSLKDLEAAVEEEEIVCSTRDKLHLTPTSPTNTTLSITSSKRRAIMGAGTASFVQIQDFVNGAEGNNESQEMSEEIAQPRLIKKGRVQ